MLLVALLSLFAGTSNAVAEPTTSNDAAVSEFLANVQESGTYEDIVGSDAEALAADAVTAIDSTGLHLTSGQSLDFSSQTIKRTPDDLSVVSIPIVGGGSAHGSSVTVLTNAAGVRAGVVEIQLHEISDTSGRVQTWVDGKQVYDEVVTAENPEPSDQGGMQTQGMDWNHLNNCLSQLGIPAWIVSGLSTACAIACAVTAGAGCVLCISAVIGFSGGAVAACVNQAWS